MKITDAKVFVCGPGRNFVTLKVCTDQGIYGLGDATLNGRELSVASYLQDHVVPCIIGRDPFQTEDIWQYLYRGAYWRRGPVAMTAIAAVDLALWDIKGKALSTPVYNLLGGKSRTGALVYGHANGRDIQETCDEVGKYISMEIAPFVRKREFPDFPPHTASAMKNCSMSPPRRDCHPKTLGQRKSIFSMCRSFSKPCVKSTAMTFICSTMSTTG